MSARRRIWLVCFAAAALVVIAVVATPAGRNYAWAGITRLRGRETVLARLAEFDQRARADTRQWCSSAGLAYPPAELALVAFKTERRMEIYARDGGAWCLLTKLPILAASGGPGPKLAEGDGQVPEGIYAIESLNPNSQFHVALRLNYPNAADVRRAEADGRTNLGGDIMIHGGSSSIGCIALGDPAIERVFVLAAGVGIERTRVIITPWDLRGPPQPVPPGAPDWFRNLLNEVNQELNKILPRL